VPGPILVTGASGFAGSHLVDFLSRSGRAVVAWHRPAKLDTERGAEDRPGVAAEAVDLLDPAAVRAAAARVRPAVVYHLAGAAHVGESWSRTESTFLINVRGTHHLLEGLRLADVAPRFLVPSSALVYRSADEALTEDHPLVPQSPYGVSKLAQELLACRAIGDGVAVTIARAFNHFGPRQDPSFVASSFARQIAEIESGRHAAELLVGNLDARRDLTDVRDTIRAYAMLADRGQPGRAYNVCSGHAVTVRELLDGLLARARTNIKVRVDTDRYRPNDMPLLVGDPSRIQREVGWKAEIPLERTLDDLLAYWRGQITA
jgi:GDP-4-dehydro-6-deoxy-D-mannose reductase